MAVIPQGQRLGEVVGQWLEPAEMPRPAGSVEVDADALGPPLVKEPRLALWEMGRLDCVVEISPEREDAGIGTIGTVAQATTCFILSSAELSGSSAEIVALSLPARSNRRTVLVCIIC